MSTNTKSVQVRNPQAHDVIGDQLVISGIGHGFEGTVAYHLLDEAGATVVEGGIQAGGMVVMGHFAEIVDLQGTPIDGSRLTLQVYGDNPGAPEEGESPGFDTNTIPITLGSAILADYTGFTLHKVQADETLSTIASSQEYGSTTVDAIFAANHDQLNNRDLIYVGQVLRIPLVG